MTVVSYPNNPVTAVAVPPFMKSSCHGQKVYGVIVIHVSIFGLVMDEPGMSFLAVPRAMDVEGRV